MIRLKPRTDGVTSPLMVENEIRTIASDEADRERGDRQERPDRVPAGVPEDHAEEFHDAAPILGWMTSSTSLPLSRWRILEACWAAMRVVGDHDDRLLELAVEDAELAEDLVGALAVEVAGRLVGDDQVGVGHDRPGDRDALLLAAGELPGVVVLPPFEADDPQGRHRAAASAASCERWVSRSGSSTFSNAVMTGIRLYIWKTKPTLSARQRVELGLGHLGQLVVVDHDRARGGPVEAGDQVQQGRLARARGAHQGEELPLLDGQVEVFEHRNPELVAAVFLADASQDDRVRRVFGHRGPPSGRGSGGLLGLEVFGSCEAGSCGRIRSRISRQS